MSHEGTGLLTPKLDLGLKDLASFTSMTSGFKSNLTKPDNLKQFQNFCDLAKKVNRLSTSGGELKKRVIKEFSELKNLEPNQAIILHSFPKTKNPISDSEKTTKVLFSGPLTLTPLKFDEVWVNRQVELFRNYLNQQLVPLQKAYNVLRKVSKLV